MAHSAFRTAKLATYFVARVLYRATLGRTAVGKALAAKAQSLGLYSAEDIQMATSFAASYYRRRLRGTRVGSGILALVSRTSGLSAQDARLAETSRAMLEPMPEDSSAHEGAEYVPAAGTFAKFRPLNCRIDAALAAVPAVNVLLPSLSARHLSGGPNTAIIVAHALAEAGISVRLVSCDSPLGGDASELLEHVAVLTGGGAAMQRLQVADASDAARPVRIGPFDLFLATAWWTAQMAKYAMRRTAYGRFLYLIQDFEPLLEPASSTYALALETYGLPHIPIINSSILHSFLAGQRVGRFADEEFARRALVFEPAIDRSVFYRLDRATEPAARHTLLFYARPVSGLRNMFELGLAALKMLASDGRLSASRWRALAVGDPLPPLPLGKELMLQSQPWLGYQRYARQVQEADVLLSLMLAPHPSYPPLEMAACGNWSVTNSYHAKTAEALARISPNILVAEPTVEAVAERLAEAIDRVERGERGSATFRMPAAWTESLAPIRDRLVDEIAALRRTPRPPLGGHVPQARAPETGYEKFRCARLKARRRSVRGQPMAGLISFLTPVYNTPTAYLQVLIASVLLQDGHPTFEWVVLDNGSSDPATRSALDAITWHPSVRLHRVPDNIGIVGGMRFCLEKASGGYVVPLDSDDVLSQDAVNVLSEAIARHGFPDLLFTDEDKLCESEFQEPYFKPHWDPVLFANSCYIAHLCAIRRDKALALGAYADAQAEGCHDWDTFVRFMLAGSKPVHISEVLYSWRMHAGSTSSNIASKPFIAESHRHVLDKVRRALPDPERFELAASPLFAGTPDWWFRRKPSAVPGMHSIILRTGDSVEKLSEALRSRPDASELVHICWEGVMIEGDSWQAEAHGLVEQFPDTVMIGGLIHDRRRILAAELVFGFGDGCTSPHRDRAVGDPGYFAQLRKQHSVPAVSSAHCVVLRRFLEDCLPVLREHAIPLECLALWLGALAQRRDRRVVFTPFVKAIAQQIPEERLPPGALGWFLDSFADLVGQSAFYSRHLGLSIQHAFVPVDEAMRTAHLRQLYARADDYRSWLEQHVRDRKTRFPLPGNPPSLCLVTTVYSGSDTKLFDELAVTALEQSYPFHRWVVVAHGSLSAGMAASLERLSADRRIVVKREPNDLGIADAMRLAVSLADGMYIVPVDSDDLLFQDTLQVLASEIARRAEPELLYSDEDLLIDGEPAAPYRRPDFDSVLNLESSYIWHLCAIRHDCIESMALYTDQAATWCHDWDTVTRIERAGGRIEHVPEILYHWRRHTASTSNRGAASDARSLSSTRHLLQKRALPGFAVREYPLNRGATELYLAIDDLPSRALRVPADAAPNFDDPHLAANPLIAVVASSVDCEIDLATREAARLMRLHSDVVAVGGRICTPHGRVLEGPYVHDRFGRCVSPYRYLAADEPGPYAMALKAHCVVQVPAGLALLRTAFLREQRSNLASLNSWSEVVHRACTLAARYGKRVAYSPLVRGMAHAIAWPCPDQEPGNGPARGLANYVGRHGLPG